MMQKLLPNIAAALAYLFAGLATVGGCTAAFSGQNTLTLTGIMCAVSAAWSLVAIAWRE